MVTNGPQIHLPKLPLPFDDHHPRLTRPSLDRLHSPSRTASGSNQPFCHSTLSGPTGRQTDRPTDRLEVCGCTYTHGYTRPDPYLLVWVWRADVLRVGSGMGATSTGISGFAHKEHHFSRSWTYVCFYFFLSLLSICRRIDYIFSAYLVCCCRRDKVKIKP